MGFDPSSKVSNAYIIIDANDPAVPWDTISGNILYWKISVGTLTPAFTDPIPDPPKEVVETTEEIVELLLGKAKIMVSDREDYQTLSISKNVPFLNISGRSMSSIQRKLREVWGGKSNTS